MDYSKFIIVSDMDNTLLNSWKEISDENRISIESFRAGGGAFIPATGRNSEQIPESMYDILTVDDSILCNGAAVYGSGLKAVLQAWPLPKVAATQFFEQHSAKLSKGLLSLATENDAHIVTSIAQLAGIACVWYKLTVLSSDQELLESLYSESADNAGIRFEFSQPTVIELMHREASKSTAMKWLMSQPKYSGRTVVAVGDYDNDSQMIKDADIGVAVKNAVLTVRQAANIITVSNDEHAIREIIENIIPDIDTSKIRKEVLQCKNR